MNLNTISSFFLIGAALFHVVFFVLESFLFQKPDGYKYFKMAEKDHMAAKMWALSQGYYNLFFALGLFGGVFLGIVPLKVFCALSMICAGIVLWFSAAQLRRGALIQILPALLGLVFLAFAPQA